MLRKLLAPLYGKLHRIVFRSFEAIKKYQANQKYNLLYEKYRDYTMIPKKVFIANMALVKEYSHIAGDVVECGVWKGGMTAAISEIYSGKQVQYHLFDSFEGLPPAKKIDGDSAIAWQKDTDSKLYFDNCRADETDAIEAIELANITNYVIHKGWFDQTLKKFKSKRPIAILRLDGDWYDSTMVCLKYLTPQMHPNGIIIVDDYYTWDGCSRAVHDFISSQKKVMRIHSFDGQVAFITMHQD